jgi:hypothetical protein
MARKPTEKKAGGQKRRRRRKMKLTLRSRKLKGGQSYSEKVGWSTQGAGRVLTGQSDAEEVTEVEHQCTLCGSMNKIPRPKTDKYKVLCAHPECGHEDEVGF